MFDCEGLIKAIDAYIQKADDNLEEMLEAAGYVNPAGTVSEASQLEERVAEALKEETDYILEQVDEALDLEAFAAEVWPGVQLNDELTEKLYLVFLEELTAYMPELVSNYLALTEPDLVVEQITKRTTSWIDSWSTELAELMKLTSHTEIDAILKKGLEEGQSIQEFTQAIMDSGIRDEYYRARRVSITEVLRAHSYAREEALVQSPAVEEKEWVHTGAHKNDPRPGHVALSGTVVPKNERFELQGADGNTYHPLFPRDSSLPASESVNCHCIHRGIVSNQVLGLSLEERRKLQAQAIADDDGAWEAELDAQNKAKAGIEED